MHVVLVEPEIPPNTGNVSRTCAISNSTLHLVEPLGFSISDRDLKRAGLDYWDQLSYYVHKDFNSVENMLGDKPFYLATTKGKHYYHEISYPKDSVLVFGKETAGLSDELLEKYQSNTIKIPMSPEFRSLNLSNSVAITLFEALRQQNFPGLLT
ncbi:tRNA (cytidine(34)-2'-O)-methyltransferase [Natranaerobius trueperi]|uniref:Putative tRNA (cytidine(34)-2'-O)-methyltransferase n=1 Tax=Natranaerobius trueperi TaxID=759412 RepID=A0A226C0K5_9FIRM|nr:tRNA (cytidine(34)-2'-O)-methyltransferase [Natranaerobius trueperi]OWZ84705.1 tRNA (uridine(34)/cytosine(34)/5-carboxymethylaminomethyluridine(34)-2'-O)-methyltransferase TrmL [Natranaerobius trueperi]